MYNYARALKVPFLIQKIYKEVSLKRAKRLIAVVFYGMNAVVSGVLFSFVIQWTNGLALAYIVVYGLIPYVLTKLLLDVKTDGRPLFIYVTDFIAYQWCFGFRPKCMTIRHEVVSLEGVVQFEEVVEHEKKDTH